MTSNATQKATVAYTSSINSSSWSITPGSVGALAGDMIVVCQSYSSSTYTVPSGWTKLVEYYWMSLSYRSCIQWKVLSSGDLATSYTFGNSGSAYDYVVILRGMPTTAVPICRWFDDTISATSNMGARPVIDESMAMIAFGVNRESVAWNTPTGFTSVYNLGTGTFQSILATKVDNYNGLSINFDAPTATTYTKPRFIVDFIDNGAAPSSTAFTPNMTSNTLPSGQVASFTDPDVTTLGGTNPWQAFDGSTPTAWATPANGPGVGYFTLQRQITGGFQMGKFDLNTTGYNSCFMYAIDGSNDGTTWTTMLIFTPTSTLQTFTIPLAARKNYVYHRLRNVSWNSAGQGINEFVFYSG